MWHTLQRWLSLKFFVEHTRPLLPWISCFTLLLLAYGLVGGLVLAPPDYQQGDAFRIIYLHVPSAFLSVMIYAVMTSFAVVSLVWRVKLADVLLKVSASIGANFTIIALVTGALWGKPMWGTYWIWDARLTSELILLFIYLGVIALRQALDQKSSAATACALWVIIGAVDLPIIHYSVVWWNTLHQGATLGKLALPSIATSMLLPLLAMIFGFIGFYLSLLLQRARLEILSREKAAQWVRTLS